MRKELHPIQQKLLELLKHHFDEPLTIRELQDETSLSSPSLVFHHIKQLEKKGLLRRNPSNPRDYQILADSPEKKITYLNLYGFACCGPSSSLLDGDPIERVPIATKLLGFSAEDAFMVRAKGASMSPKINNKDLVIVQKSKVASNGEIIVCVDNSGAKIKRYNKKSDKVILSSLNPEYEPFIADEDFRIEGVVKGVISYDMGAV